MGEHSLDIQIPEPVQPGDGVMILRRDAQAAHPRVQGQVDPHPASRPGQGLAVGLVGHHLGQPPAAQQGDLPRRSVAQNQNCPPDAGFPQPDALCQTGHGEGIHPCFLEAPGHRYRPVAIGVRLHHCHEPAAGSQGILEDLGVVDQRPLVQLPPGPAFGVGADGAQGVQHQGHAGG